jgi:iron complex outermembrane receptor protein
MMMRLMALALLAAGTAAFAQDAPPDEGTPPAEEPAPAEGIPVQEPPPEVPPGEAVTLDALEVTAQRRVQKLVDVPVAVTAFGQDQIEARGIDRLDDLNSLVPGLQVSRSPANTTISQLTIRGSSQINPAIYWDPAVGVYLDEVYIGKAQGSIFDIVDIVSVEALRGPQGTLYGRNTIAGTVNFRSREPSGTFGGTAGLEYGELGATVYRASLDLPAVGIASATFGVRSEKRDPWIETTPSSPVDGLNDRNNQGAHAGVLLSIMEGLEATYHLDYGKTDQTSQFLQLYRSDDPDLAPYLSRKRRNTADINAPSSEYADVQGHSLGITWQATDWLTLKSITGLRTVTWIDQLDLDGSPEDIAHSKRDTDYEQKSQDFTVSGQLFETLHYTAGAYLFEDDGFTNNPIYVEIYQGGMRVPFEFDSRYGTHTRATAYYGQLDWNAIEPLTLSAGVRRTTEKKDLDRVFGWRPGGSPTPYTYLMEEGYKTDGVTSARRRRWRRLHSASTRT